MGASKSGNSGNSIEPIFGTFLFLAKVRKVVVFLTSFLFVYTSCCFYVVFIYQYDI